MKKSLSILSIAVLLFILTASVAMANPHNLDYNARTCAQCHSTHAAATSTYLLNPDISSGSFTSVTTVCMACHDGTLGADIDVVSGNWRVGSFTTAGVIDQIGSGASAHSVDMVQGVSATIGSAPGNPNSNSAVLTCASCHNPHGSYNAKLLQVAPEGATGGVGTATLDVVDVTANGVVFSAAASGAPWLRTVVPRGSTTWDAVEYGVTLTIGDKEYTSTIFVDHGHGLEAEDNFLVDFKNGRIGIEGDIVATDDTVLTLAEVEALTSIDVEFTKPLYVTEDYTFVGLGGASMPVYGDPDTFEGGMTAFCAGCHSNYNIANRRNDSYVDPVTGETRYGHNVYRGLDESYEVPMQWGDSHGATTVSTCTSCHYPHGTEPMLQVDADKQPVTVKDSAADNQRYISYAICYRCHVNSHGETFVWDNFNRPDWNWDIEF